MWFLLKQNVCHNVWNNDESSDNEDSLLRLPPHRLQSLASETRTVISIPCIFSLQTLIFTAILKHKKCKVSPHVNHRPRPLSKMLKRKWIRSCATMRSSADLFTLIKEVRSGRILTILADRVNSVYKIGIGATTFLRTTGKLLFLLTPSSRFFFYSIIVILLLQLFYQVLSFCYVLPVISLWGFYCESCVKVVTSFADDWRVWRKNREGSMEWILRVLSMEKIAECRELRIEDLQISDCRKMKIGTWRRGEDWNLN